MDSNHYKKMQHLHWRAGFGLSPKEWQRVKSQPLNTTAKKMIQEAKNEKAIVYKPLYTVQDILAMSKEERTQKRKEDRKEVNKINVNWMLRMSSEQHAPMLEKMTVFWHNHFACQIKEPNLAIQYLNVLRQNALGSFKDLVIGVAKTPAMIRYLNNQQNRKQKPNENFARELMELFTIGRGSYSEKDIKEVARAFTGWSSQLGTFVFKEHWHDHGQKTFMGKTGKFGGEDIIDMILEKRETARYITKKVYHYFVNDKIDETKVEELANRFYDSNYNIGELMATIFTSNWFYDSKNIGVRIKSPLEYLAGMIRLLDAKFEDPRVLLVVQKTLGQVLFNPPNVAGWPGGRAWIDNATLLLRLNLPNVLLDSKEVNIKIKEEFEAQKRNKRLENIKLQVELGLLEKTFGNLYEENNLSKFADYLIQPQINKNLDLVKQHSVLSDTRYYFKSTLIRLLSLPEYQLC